MLSIYNSFSLVYGIAITKFFGCKFKENNWMSMLFYDFLSLKVNKFWYASSAGFQFMEIPKSIISPIKNYWICGGWVVKVIRGWNKFSPELFT